MIRVVSRGIWHGADTRSLKLRAEGGGVEQDAPHSLCPLWGCLAGSVKGGFACVWAGGLPLSAVVLPGEPSLTGSACPGNRAAGREITVKGSGRRHRRQQPRSGRVGDMIGELVMLLGWVLSALMLFLLIYSAIRLALKHDRRSRIREAAQQTHMDRLPE